MAALATVGIALSSAAPAEAAKYQFGREESLHRLMPTTMKWKQGEAMQLAYRVSKHWFLLPYTVTADGYALTIEGTSQHVPLSAEQIAALQKDGLLPAKLPRFELSMMDLVIGHLLWLVLVPLAGWELFRRLPVSLRRRSAGPAPAVESAPVATPPLSRLAPRTAAPASATVSSAQAPAPSAGTEHRSAPAPERQSPPAAPALVQTEARVPAPAPAAAPPRPEPGPQASPRVASGSSANPSSPKMHQSTVGSSTSVARIRCRVKSLKVAA